MALIFTLSSQTFVKAESYGSSAAKAQAAAETLYTLGLMRGIGISADGKASFELERSMTREEAITMLVRLLGEENSALSGSYDAPFSDLSSWARPYVCFAYAKGYAYGRGDGVFGGTDYVSASEYLTFALRALGYESEKDFEWDSAWSLSDKLGLTKGEYAAPFPFLRGDAALISLGSLSQTKKQGSVTLLTALCEKGAVSYSAVNNAGLSSLLGEKALSGGEIFAKNREAVFEIISFDSSGNIKASGLGFFLDGATLDINLDRRGLGVVSYNIIKDAYSARIRCYDGKEFEVLGSYAYSEAANLALIKASGEGYVSLKLENSRNVSENDTLFSVGPSSVSSCGAVFTGGLGVSYIHGTGAFAAAGAPVSNLYGKLVGIASSKSGNLAVTAETLRFLKYTGFRSFSRLKGYEGFNDAPDFGAFFGFEPVKTVSQNPVSGYFYDEASIRAAYPNAFENYQELLQKQGFVYTGELDTADFYRVYYKKGSLNLSLSFEGSGGRGYYAISLGFA